MTDGLGSIRGQIRIDAKQALAEYAAVRAANASTRASLAASSAAFTRVGIGALAAAAPIAILFGAAVNEAAKFQKKMDFFGAVTNASQADMDAVAAKALSMAKTTVFSANQMADAFVEFGKAGISTKDILNGVADATANLAQAADIPIQNASNIIVSTMKTFGIAAAGTGHIADILAGAANASIIDVEDLATSLKYAGGIAAAAKVPFESVVTAISLLGNAGIKGSTAGTSLRQIMVSLVTQSPKATKELEALGIVTKKNGNLFITATGQIKPLAEIFQILQDHTRSLTDAQRLAATKIIFNSRALASANILLKDGAKGFAEMNSQIQGVKAADVASKRLDNLAGDVTRFKNAVTTMLIQAGGPLQNMLRNIVQHLTSLVRWFGNLSPEQQKMILYTLAMVGAFLLFIGTLSLIIGQVLKVIQVYRDLKLAMIFLGDTKLFQNIVSGFRAIGAAMLANPMVLIIVGIIALVAALIYCWIHFKSFRDVVKGVFDWIKTAAEDVWKALVHAFDNVAHAVSNVGDFFKKAGEDYYNYFIKPIYDAANAVINFFVDFGHAFIRIVDQVLGFLSYHWKAVVALLLGPIGLAIDAITTHWNWLVKFFTKIFDAIAGVFKVSWTLISKVVMVIVDTLVGWFKVQLSILTTVITTVFNGIKVIAGVIWDGIKFAIINPTLAIYNFVSSVFTKVYDFVAKILTSLWHFIDHIFTTIWNTVYGWMSSIYNTIADIVSRVYKVGSGIVTSIWDGVSSRVGWFIGKVAGWIQDLINSVWDWATQFFRIGEHLIEGIWQGIESKASWLYDKVSGFLSDIWNSILGFFGIHSPSRKAAWAGQMLMQGFADGITKNQHVVYKAMNGFLQNFPDGPSIGLTTNASGQYTAGLSSVLAARNAQKAAVLNNTKSMISHVGPGIVVEQLHNHEAVPEKLTTTMPRLIRKLNYMAPGPGR